MHLTRAGLRQMEAMAFDLFTAAIVLPVVIIPAAIAAAAHLLARLARRVRAA